MPFASNGTLLATLTPLRHSVTPHTRNSFIDLESRNAATNTPSDTCHVGNNPGYGCTVADPTLTGVPDISRGQENLFNNIEGVTPRVPIRLEDPHK